MLLLCACSIQHKDYPKVQNGLLDARDWDFQAQGLLKLDGHWSFYWDQLIKDQSEINRLKATDGTCNLIGFWTEEVTEGTLFEQNGVATYHLKILLPDTVNAYFLKINTVFTAYELWGNNKLLTKVGEVGRSPEMTVNSFQTQLVKLPVDREIDLFLQIASWEHRRGGGVSDSILMGTEKQIRTSWVKNYTRQLLSFMLIVTLGIFLILLYFFYPNKSYLYLGLFAVLGSLRIISIDEIVIQELFEQTPYFINQRLRYLGFFASVGFVLLYVDHEFYQFSNKYFRFGTKVLLLFSLAILIIPFRWSSYLSPYFQVFSVPLAAYGLYIGGRVIIKGGRKAWFLLVGGGIIFLTTIQYILYANNLLEGTLYHNFGFIAFIISQALALGLNNRSVYMRSNQLAEELIKLNQNLEHKVKQRTATIQEQSEELRVQHDRIIEQADKLRLSNEQLQALDQAKTRFFANISHELRTPLTLILGITKRLKAQLIGKLNLEEVALIEKHSHLLHQLINQLLDITKLEAKEMKLKLQKVPIISLLKSYLAAFESLAASKNIQLSFTSNLTTYETLVDKQALEKISYNLLSNALKFTPDGGQVSLDVAVEKAFIQMTVKDTGIGIPADQLPHIFDRFYRVDQGVNRSYEGTGIGLALAKELVVLHKGNIRVESEEGMGTRFIITLPIQNTQTAGETTVQANERAELSPMIATEVLQTLVDDATDRAKSDNKQQETVILVVEDHPDLQAFIKAGLSDYQIIQAFDGEAGIRKAIEHLPDLIISDVMMPHKSGYELCEHLKKDERTCHIPIILLTARAEKSDKLHGLQLGADDYLAKPFDQQELEIRIENLIQTRKVLQKHFAEKVDNMLYTPKEVSLTSADELFVKKVFDITAEHYGNTELNVEKLASLMHVSTRQLSRKIKAILGYAPSKLLQNFRLQKAKEL
ncbi:MAG: ATP-binding protein, partial [Flammeovirgaceae bacterium]